MSSLSDATDQLLQSLHSVLSCRTAALMNRQCTRPCACLLCISIMTNCYTAVGVLSNAQPVVHCSIEYLNKIQRVHSAANLGSHRCMWGSSSDEVYVYTPQSMPPVSRNPSCSPTVLRLTECCCPHVFVPAGKVTEKIGEMFKEDGSVGHKFTPQGSAGRILMLSV